MEMSIPNFYFIILFSVTINIHCYHIQVGYGHIPAIYNHRILHRLCYVYFKWADCPVLGGILTPGSVIRHYQSEDMNRMLSVPRPGLIPNNRRHLNLMANEFDAKKKENTYSVKPSERETTTMEPELDLKLNVHIRNEPVIIHPNLVQETSTSVDLNETVTTRSTAPIRSTLPIETTTVNSPITNASVSMRTSTVPEHKEEYSSIDSFLLALDRFERKFYSATFARLLSLSPPDRQDNGMSFVQSGLFLQLVLTALSTEVDPDTKDEIDTTLGLTFSDLEKVKVMREVVSLLPNSSDDLKFRWSSRLVLSSRRNVSRQFAAGAAAAVQLRINTFNGSETAEHKARILNEMVERDSGGAIRNTFEEEEMSEGLEAVQVSTLYLRALWRAAPTVLNGTRPFHDSPAAPRRNARMIRINDLMRYAYLPEWDAEALEIMYSTSGLSLVALVPRGRSLRRVAREATATSLGHVCARMHTLRVAATMPLYTLRMTLLLPNKLKAMGITRLANVTTTQVESLRLSHAVQRIMFWAEAGRNAFKDDGIEWDEPPELELVIDRPYIFFVRWRNITLMNGNFVL